MRVIRLAPIKPIARPTIDTLIDQPIVGYINNRHVLEGQEIETRKSSEVRMF